MKSAEVDEPAETDFPAFYQAADASSLMAQKSFLRAMQLRLAGLFLAASGGAIASLDGWRAFGAWLAVLGLLVALGAEIYNLAWRPDRRWYEGRAAAESAKTLAWRYMVRGEKFEVDANVDSEFVNEIDALQTDLANVPPAEASSSQISSRMRAARALSYDERKAFYREHRLENQRRWYAKKASFNDKRVHRWMIVTIGLEVLGLLAAILLLTQVIAFDALGVISALAAAFTAWTQSRQYETLAAAYGVTSQELASVIDQLDALTDESLWPKFVGQAEEAISREHTLWRASRGIRVSR
ncbi:DUF4231 domain-containing protein [uncultured Microbacterium sp.]|uniref:DUF4231 domain-containing protein n=1 Tax=uncultured Microbacterium sp. TaxID=191216 RepID=UPI0025D964B1|nr:DUF4231 domain-containing protein [uncultured Microbacterium sp.]